MFTVEGRYHARGWTEWTQGFQFGSALLQFDATGDARVPRARPRRARSSAWRRTSRTSASTTTASTTSAPTARCGAWRARAGSTPATGSVRFYELALKVSGAVQARRWTRLPDGGFIYSFNGAHSLFVDTIRSLRALALGHLLGQRLLEEQDAAVSLLERLVQHARATAQYNVYYGRGRDRFDVRGRVAHESLFNVANGTYRGPSTQQGYSPFTTWTRGLAWAMLGFAEQLEFLETVPGRRAATRAAAAPTIDAMMLEAARATCDHYIDDRRRRRRAVLGRRRAGPRGARRLGRPSGRSVQRSRAGRQLGRRDRARRACCASAASSTARRCRRGHATSRPVSASSTRCSTPPDRT